MLLKKKNAREDGSRFQSYRLEDSSFMYAATAEVDAAGKVMYITDLHHQDHFHVIKRLIAHLNYVSRAMFLGAQNPAHMADIRFVVKQFSDVECGLRKMDYARNRDTMDVSSACRVAMRTLQEKMKKIQEGVSGKPISTSHSAGTIRYLEIVWKYTEVFEGKYSTYYTKVKHCSYIANYLLAWRHWVNETPEFNLKEHFLTRETYLDTRLSCHAVVLTLKVFNDSGCTYKCPLCRCGSDVCECFFARVCSAVRNRRASNILTMQRSAGAQNTINNLKADPHGPKFKRKNKTSEAEWKRD